MQQTQRADRGGSAPLDVRVDSDTQKASFSLRNRIGRSLFMFVWALFAAWTPPPAHRWRCMILRLFGARIGSRVRLYGSTVIWLPANLSIGDSSIVGPRVRLYNQGRIDIGAGTVVSQGAHVVASTHDVTDPLFQLVIRPVHIADRAWIAADAFVGPGVRVGEGAVLGARGVAVRNLDPFMIYGGNPARPIKLRVMSDER
jgi:putative colanic acid biosynthesis acetyltransferase WcaF